MTFSKQFEAVIMDYRSAKQTVLNLTEKLQALNDKRSGVDMEITEMETQLAIAQVELKDMEMRFDRMVTTNIIKDK